MINVLLDSGAYSAWKLKTPVSLDKYSNYVERNLDWVDNYIVLDEIIPHDVEAAAKASFDNLVAMRQRGLNPMPVLHAGEDISWLHRSLDLGCDYVCLAGSSLASNLAVERWYESCWSSLVNSGGLPTVKVHALGEGREASLKQYPWKSADSTTWIYHAQIQATTQVANGRSVNLRKDRSSAKSAPDARELAEFDDDELNAILAREGIKREGFMADGNVSLLLRTYLMGKHFIELEARVNAMQPIRFMPSGFFAEPRAAPPVAIDRFDMYLVRSNNNTAFAPWLYAGARGLLVSFFYIEPPNNATQGWSEGDFLRKFKLDPWGATRAEPKFNKYMEFLEEGLTNARQQAK